MSVTFSIRGIEIDWENPAQGTCLNLANGNAREVLNLLGLDDPYLCGDVRARDLKAKCLSVLGGMKDGSADPGYVDVVEATSGCATVIHCGRRPGYLTEKLNLLLAMADRAGDIGVITWG